MGVCRKTLPSHRPQQRCIGSAVETALPSCLGVPIAPTEMTSQDSVREHAVSSSQIENPLLASLSGWFAGRENSGSQAARSWHFQLMPVAKPKLVSLLSSRPSFVICRICESAVYPSHDPLG